jgi:hypothetical protein
VLTLAPVTAYRPSVTSPATVQSIPVSCNFGQHPWGGKTYYRQLRIDPLPPESADELLDALLGADVALGPLKQLLVERTEANPLFLEESVRALVEMGALAGERGAYRLTRPVEHLTIPATVRAILAARTDRLAPETKRLLQAAAVIGKDVPMPLILAIADAPAPEVRAELTHLQAAEFLYETRLFPDLEYTFKHALTHEVAYQGLLHDRQRALHARVTKAIERLSTERLAEQAERLAHHALRGELWEKAVAYLRQAGLRAMARAANREAIAHLEQALGVLRHLPDIRETTELTIDLRIDLRNALVPLGDRARIGGHLHEAEGARQDARRPAPARADRHLQADPVPVHWRLRRGRQIRAGGPEHRTNPRRSLDRGGRHVLFGRHARRPGRVQRRGHLWRASVCMRMWRWRHAGGISWRRCAAISSARPWPWSG